MFTTMTHNYSLSYFKEYKMSENEVLNDIKDSVGEEIL